MNGIIDSIYSTLMAEGHSPEYVTHSVEQFRHTLSSKPYSGSSGGPNRLANRRIPSPRGYVGVPGVYSCYPFHS